MTESLADIQYFGVMVLVCIMSFAHGIMVLDINEIALNEQEIASGKIVDEYESVEVNMMNNVWVNGIMSQYLLGLGEFGDLISNFNDSDDKILLWIYFGGATILTQIIFINTLIAILGDTYGRIMDNREQYAII